MSLRIALIGYGHWGPNYARICSELSETELVAICEIDSRRLQRAKDRYSHLQTYSDVRELLKNNSVDAVIISTPASTHYELARTFLESGRHILLEKPMALEVEQCESLTDLAERKKKVLMVGHTFLYNASIRKMKEVVRCSEFGRVYYMHATRTNLGPIRQDVNALWDLAPHDISIFNYLLDQKPLWASAIGSRVLRNSNDDVAFLTLGYSDGVIANIHVSWADPDKVREVVAVGSHRRVVCDDLNTLESVRIFEKGVSRGDPAPETSYGEFRLSVRDGDILSPKIMPSEPLKEQLVDFVGAIREQRQPVSDAGVGTQVVRALVAAEASMRLRGAPREV
jgi:predicted dehydrogenase